MDKKKKGFSVPSVADIKEASKIRVENKPTIFEAKSSTEPSKSEADNPANAKSARDATDTSSRGLVSSTGEASSSSHQGTTVQPASYHPHAIVVNPLQVSSTSD